MRGRKADFLPAGVEDLLALKKFRKTTILKIGDDLRKKGAAGKSTLTACPARSQHS
jgi:hypothetical protein